MTDSNAIKDRLIERLRGITQRPGAYGPGVGHLFHTALADIAFLDGIKLDVTTLIRYGKRGVPGPFLAMFGDANYDSEHVSELATTAADLGYLDVAVAATFRAEQLRELQGIDVTMKALTDSFGEPHLRIGDKVLAYKTADGWSFCDFVHISQPKYEPENRQFVVEPEDALLRNIRLPTAKFMDGLVLTRLGMELRWGMDWSMRAPNMSSNYPEGVHNQLLGIMGNDPSERTDARGPMPPWAHHVR